MVVIRPLSMPSSRCSTWATGARQLVVHEALEMIWCLYVCVVVGVEHGYAWNGGFSVMLSSVFFLRLASMYKRRIACVCVLFMVRTLREERFTSEFAPIFCIFFFTSLWIAYKLMQGLSYAMTPFSFLFQLLKTI